MKDLRKEQGVDALQKQQGGWEIATKAEQVGVGEPRPDSWGLSVRPTAAKLSSPNFAPQFSPNGLGMEIVICDVDSSSQVRINRGSPSSVPQALGYHQSPKLGNQAHSARNREANHPRVIAEDQVTRADNLAPYSSVQEDHKIQSPMHRPPTEGSRGSSIYRPIGGREVSQNCPPSGSFLVSCVNSSFFGERNSPGP